MSDINTRTNNGFSRRTIVKGAAWSVPVIAVAAATPSAAASTVADTDLGLAFTDGGISLTAELGDALTVWFDGLPALAQTAAGAAFTALITGLAGVVNAEYQYPLTFIVTNNGPGTLSAGEPVMVALDYGADVLNIGALNEIVGVTAVGTASGANLTVIAGADVAPGSEVAQVIVNHFTPLTVSIDLAGSDVEAGTVTGTLTGDSDPNQNVATHEYGLFVDLLDGLSPLITALNSALAGFGVSLPVLDVEVFAVEP